MVFWYLLLKVLISLLLSSNHLSTNSHHKYYETRDKSSVGYSSFWACNGPDRYQHSTEAGEVGKIGRGWWGVMAKERQAGRWAWEIIMTIAYFCMLFKSCHRQICFIMFSSGPTWQDLSCNRFGLCGASWQDMLENMITIVIPHAANK